MTQNDTQATVAWYRSHETTSQIGFVPDGMCQKICRTARNIGPGFASALAQQLATPEEFRVHDISKITRGMVMYFDDPRDSNPYGHITTVVGRRKNGNRENLSNILVRTNSVRSGEIVVVDAAYFSAHWGDSFQFAGEWINGVALDLPDRPKREPQPPRIGRIGLRKLEDMIDVYDRMIENHWGNPRITNALRRDRREIRSTIAKFTMKGK